MTRYRWLLGLCLSLALVPRISGAEDDDDEKSSDVNVVWYTIDAGGGVSRFDNIVIAGTTGQAEAGNPCVSPPLSLVGGFWVPDGFDRADGDVALSSLRQEVESSRLIQARIIEGGIEIRLEHEFPAQSTEVILERSETAEGPWVGVPFERRGEDSELVMVHRGATADRTLYYRVQMAAPGALARTFGPAMILVDKPIVEFSLLPISPNPSHGVALIAWSVPRESRVRLTVHDVQGRQVAVLADGVYAAGRHIVRWDSLERGGSSPGMYFVRLQGPDGVRVRRVVLAF